MQIRDSLVDILLEIDEVKYRDFIIYCSKYKLLYIKILKVLHGMLTTSTLCYKKFKKDIEVIGHEVNLFDIYVAKKIINSKQHILTWHVDNVKASHINPKVNTRFTK